MDFNKPLYNILARGYLLYFITWIALLSFYIYLIVTNKKTIIEIDNEGNKKIPKFCTIFLIVYLFNIILALFGPNFYIRDQYGTHSYGFSTNYTYFCSTLYILLSIILMFKGNKDKIKKYIPMILFIILLIITMIIQIIHPSIILTPTAMTLTVFTMYFTIENPDLKIIEELKKNRSLTSKSYIEKTNFLFRMSAEVRKPIENIKELNDYNIESNDIKEIKENSKEIDLNIRNANFTINNVLDVSSLDTKNINIVKNKYNIKKLLNEIYLREKKKINNIRFDFNIGELPEYLYGDSIRLKQVLICILDNLIENTKEGFIEVNVNSINKYDVCRLIITIENSGIPLSLEEINNILDNEKEIDENISLEDINKLINMMNGSLNIKSEEGNEFTISIDSIIVEPKKEEITNETDILFISNNERILKGLEYAFEEYTTNSVMSGIDAIDLIKSGENYNLIIIDDEMKPISGLETLKRLRKENINIPAIIMLDEGKEHIKNHYIKDGFIDYIIKSDIKNEIKRIIKKML